MKNCSLKKTNLFFFIFAFLLMITTEVIAEEDYQTIDWLDLMPAMDLAALESRPIDHGDGSESSAAPSWESLSDDIVAELESWNDPQDSFEEDAYQSALTSTRTVDKFNGENVRLPGFIVPLEFDDDMTITQFFLVPYFGACIHLPPPPPNQIVLVDFPDGMQMEALYTPFWISGKLSIQIAENEVGTSAYAIQMDSLEVYQ